MKHPTVLKRIQPDNTIATVAEVAEFEDGTVVLRWLSETPSTAIYESRDAMLLVHGHAGKSYLALADDYADAWQEARS